MGENGMNKLFNIEEKVRQWWLDLRRERKYNGTSALSKATRKISEEEQDKVRHIISNLIREDIYNCIRSKDITLMTTLCCAINGCFDNFIHAADATNIAFNDIIEFIYACIEECESILFMQETPKYNAVQALKLLHCLSRIMVLILKLRRPLKCERKSQQFYDIDNHITILLVKLSYKVTSFLKADEILMDTKCNFVMGSLLIREIILGSREKVIKFHEKFVDSLPEKLVEGEFQLNILRFILSNAVLNTWSNIVMNSNSTRIYLRFFVQLCEKYSRQTTVILNISRALFLLIRNECFKDCVLNFLEKDQIDSLLSCVWMLEDHPVACIRHSAKYFLQILAVYEKFRSSIISSLPSLPNDKRSYFITLAAIANELGSRSLLELDLGLFNNLLSALRDPTLVTHVIYALESLILKDSLVNDNFAEWCETWILPLIVSLSTVGFIVAADIEKLLDGLFKRYPMAVFYVINKWSDPNNDEELRYIITAVKIYSRHEPKQLSIAESKNEESSTSYSDVDEKKWKYMISEKLLRLCLYHSDDEIRVSAFSLIIQGLKSTEKYTKQDFNLIRYFFMYNLNNQQPATRQKILALLKKMLSRFAVSLTVLKRTEDSSIEDIDNYREFKNWLVSFCFSNVFDGANYNRLNTVLSTLLYIIEYTGNIEVDESVANLYWRKILVALRSSYEENKVMAVSLARELNIHNFLQNSTIPIRSLFEKAIRLSSKMEPPNVLTGSYLIQILIDFPSFQELMIEYSIDYMDIDSKLKCIMILSNLLESQVKNAEDNLIKAAVNGPMYGTLFAIRLILQTVNFSDIDQGMWRSSNMGILWPKFINTLINSSFRMIDIVSSVVNSSSPEGHLPSDFQYNFQFTTNDDLTVLRSKDGFEEQIEFESLNLKVENLQLEEFECQRGMQEILKDCDSIIRRFNRIFLVVYNSSSFSQDMAIEFYILFQRVSHLMKNLMTYHDSNNMIVAHYLNCLSSIKEKLEKCIKIYKKNSFMFGKPTAQILLLCAWRSIKEACLFLGDFMSKLSLEKAFELNLITEETAIDIGEQLRTLLCEIKHRGAFEQAYVGFGQIMNALWKSPSKNLSELPIKWLEEILNEIKLPLKEQKMKFCSSRRSAGLPFLVQAIISSELQCINSAKIQTLDLTMHTLLDLVEKDDSINLECKIHSLNILRALFKHALLGEHVVPYVSRALMVSIRGSRADAWSIRNSSSLLFSSLVIRIFGVARNKDALSKKNKMTSKIFFQRYPELYEFFLSEMRLGCRGDELVNGYYPQPNVFLVLLILGRLYPPSIEDSVNVDFTEFVPLIDTSCHSPTLKIRELGARALVPLISPERFKEELGMRFSHLYPDKSIDSNHRHGVLLQIKTILNEISNVKHVKESLEESGSFWIENTRWILDDTEKCRTPYLIQIAYTQIIHVIYKTCPSLREIVKNVINNEKLYTNDDGKLKICKNIPGYFAFREILSFVKFDIAAHDYFEFKDDRQLIRIYLSLLKNEVDEVKCIPLRFLNYITLDNREESIEEDDVNSITLRIQDLSCVQNEKCFDFVKFGILTQPIILQYIVEYIKSFLENIHDSVLSRQKVTMRLWMSVISAMLLKDIITPDDFCKICNKNEELLLFMLNSLLNLVECGDTDISIGAFTCYCVFFFDIVERQTKCLNQELISYLIKLLFSFSDSDADVKQRTAASNIFNKYYYLFGHDLFKNDNQLFSIWTLPVRLMVDDDPIVRRNIVKIVPKFQKYLRENSQNFIIFMEDVSAPKLTSISSKAQEDLLDCYINLLGEKNLFNLIVQMVAWSFSAYVNTINFDHMTKQNEAGVFEKGNPNPFCEESAFADLILNKLEQLKKLVDMKCLFETKLNPSHVMSIQDFLPTITLPHFPETLRELSYEIINILTESSAEIYNETMSLLPVYIFNLKKALDI